MRPRGDRDMDTMKRPAAIAGANGECRADAFTTSKRVGPVSVAMCAPCHHLVRAP